MQLIGQKRAQQVCDILVKSALADNSLIPHLLLTGGGGLGKTSLAKTLGERTSRDVVFWNGTSLTKIENFINVLQSCHKMTLHVFDECQKIPNLVQQQLYTILEEFRFEAEDKYEGKVNYKFEPFTAIALTTHPAALLNSFKLRFKVVCPFEDYTLEEATEIAAYYVDKAEIDIPDDWFEPIAVCCRMNPRLIVNCVDWLKKCSNSHKFNSIKDLEFLMSLQSRNLEGYTDADLRYLEILKGRKRPISLATVANHLGLEKSTITEELEPFLIKQKRIDIVAGGRILLKETK